MKEKLTWLSYSSRSFFRKVLRKLKCKGKLTQCQFDRTHLDLEAAHGQIREYILRGEPAMVARFGSNEAIATAEAMGIALGVKKGFRKETMLGITRNAGVFSPEEDMILRYGEISKASAMEADLLGVWSSVMQDYLVNEVCRKDLLVTALGNLEPFHSTSLGLPLSVAKKCWLFIPLRKPLNPSTKNGRYSLKIPMSCRSLNCTL